MEDLHNYIYLFPVVGVIALGAIIFKFGFKNSANPPSFEELSEIDNKKSKKKKIKNDKKTTVKIKDLATKKVVVKIRKDDAISEKIINKTDEIDKPKKLKDKKKKVEEDKHEKPQVMEGWMTIPKKEKKPVAPVKSGSPKHNLKDAKKTIITTNDKVLHKTEFIPDKLEDRDFDDYPETLEAAADKMYANEPDYDVQLEYRDNVPDEEEDLNYKHDSKLGNFKAGSSGTSASNSTVNDWELLSVPQMPVTSGAKEILVPPPKIKPILKLTPDTDWQGISSLKDSSSHASSLYGEFIEGQNPQDNMTKYSVPSAQCWGAQLLPEVQSTPTDDDNTQWFDNYEAYFDDGEDDNIKSSEDSSNGKLGKQSPIQKSYLDEIEREKDRKHRERVKGTFNGNLFEFAEDANSSTHHSPNTPVYSGSGSGYSTGGTSGGNHVTSGGTGDVSLNKRLGLVYENVMPPIKHGTKAYKKDDVKKEDKGSNNSTKKNKIANNNNPVSIEQTNSYAENPDDDINNIKKKKKNKSSAASKPNSSTASKPNGPSNALSNATANLVSVTG